MAPAIIACQNKISPHSTLLKPNQATLKQDTIPKQKGQMSKIEWDIKMKYKIHLVRNIKLKSRLPQKCLLILQMEMFEQDTMR